ncbi:MAG: hypothetical protein G01um101417_257 [Parcubacteria group bacterium Gr01-1014_17]|nr:MAG: hypothetical protein G01um101417_257 [Parcubacteria group bacterium Gr01-1014_17]
MQRFQTKKRIRDFLYSPIALLLLLALIIFLSRAALGAFVEYREAARAEGLSAARAGELAAQEELLRENATLFGSARGAEQEIREKLRMAKPGEEVIMIVDDPATQDGDVMLNSASWLDKLKRWLFGE